MFKCILQVHLTDHLHVASRGWSRDILENEEAIQVGILDIKLHITDFHYLAYVISC